MGPFDLLSDPLPQRLTWTLLHFLWQGLAVAVVLSVVVWTFRVSRARIRYVLCLTAMGAMAACPVITFVMLEDDLRLGSGDEYDVGPDEAVGWDEAQRSPTLLTAEPKLTTEAKLTTEPKVGLRPSLPPAATVASTSPTVARQPRVVDYTHAVQPYLLAGWIARCVLLSLRLMLGLIGVQRLRWSRVAIPKH